MTLHFIEPLTKGILQIGNQSLIEKYKDSTPTGMYSFIRAIDSEIMLMIDNVPFCLKKNHIVSITPDQYFAVTNLSECIVYQFNRDFYCIKDHDKEVNCMGLLFHSNAKIPAAFLDDTELLRFKQIHENLLEEFKNEDSVQAEMLQVILKNLIIRTTRLIKKQNMSTSKNTSSKSELLRQFTILVETNFRKEHQVSFYADKLFKSAKTLSNNFNSMNTTPLQIIHNRIVLETKRLLLYSDMNLKEIAFELGFNDTSNLSKLFKKRVNRSPLSYREEYFSKNGKN